MTKDEILSMRLSKMEQAIEDIKSQLDFINEELEDKVIDLEQADHDLCGRIHALECQPKQS